MSELALWPSGGVVYSYKFTWHSSGINDGNALIENSYCGGVIK